MLRAGRATFGAVVLTAALGASIATAQAHLAGDVTARFRYSSTNPTAGRAMLKFRPAELPLVIADPSCAGAPSTIRIATSTQVGAPIPLSCVN